MDKRHVYGLSQLKFAVVDKYSDEVISLHQHPDAAEDFRKTSQFADAFEVVQLSRSVDYKTF